MVVNVRDWVWKTKRLYPNSVRGPLPFIPITSLDDVAESSPKPIYAIVCGGIATGKSHVIRHNVKKFLIADVDDFMVENGFTDYDRNGEQFQFAMDGVADLIKTAKAEHRHILSMETGSNYDFLRYRLVGAQADGYDAVVIHVQAPLEQCLSQNTERANRGEHHVQSHEINRIKETIEESMRSMQRLLSEDRDLIGYYCSHDNTR